MALPSDIQKIQQSVLLLSQAKALEKAGKFADSVRMYQQAIAVYPQNPAGYQALIRLLIERRDTANADRVIKAVPATVYQASRPLQNLHALQLILQGCYQQALPILQGLVGSPDVEASSLQFNLGACHNFLQETDAALAHYEKAYQLGLRTAQLFKDWAGIYQQRGLIEPAERMYKEALARFPQDDDLRHEYGGLLLKAGRYPEGFRLYRHRWNSLKEERPALSIPEWDGASRPRALLVLREQGVGEQIVFSALLPALCRKADKVTAAFDIRLAPLIRRSFPEVEVLTKNLSADEVARDYDAYVQCVDAGLLCPEGIGWKDGYLRADQSLTARLRAKYRAMFPGKTLVGVSWKSKRPELGEMKSIDLLEWKPVLESRACQFICLQYGDVAHELQAAKESLGIEIYQDPEIDSFANIDGLAAQIDALDLTISTSNSTAHIAAAIDAPTWVILPTGRGLLWYWGYKESETDWYPHARLFRAHALNDWQPVLRAVAAALDERFPFPA